jgi:hypothetical protein
VQFLGEQMKSYKTLAARTLYAKLTAIKVLKNLGNNFEFTLVRIKHLVDIGVVPPSKYSYGVDCADKVVDEVEDEVENEVEDEVEEEEEEDERKMSAVEEVTPFVQQILPLALAVVDDPVKKSDLLSALTDLPAVPPDNVTQSNAVAHSNQAQFFANFLFPQKVSNVFTPNFVLHS